jgi:hypothetical protein
MSFLSWSLPCRSHATYYFIAAGKVEPKPTSLKSTDFSFTGCHLSLGNVAKAKALLDEVPLLLDKRKIGGRDLPTEVFIRKKSGFLLFTEITTAYVLSPVAFYKQKETRRGGSEADYVASIRISPAEGSLSSICVPKHV